MQLVLQFIYDNFASTYVILDIFPLTVDIHTIVSRHVETVALLSKLDVDKHIDVEIKLDELDLTSAESKATYAKNKEYILEFRSDNISKLYENSVEALPIDIEKYLKEIINFIQENNSSYLDTLRDFKSDILSSEEFFKIQYGSIVSEDVELFLKIYKSKYISYRHALIILRSLVELIIEFKYLIQNPSYREKFIGDTEFKQSDKFSVNDFKQLGSKRFKNGKISIAKMAVDIGEKNDSDEKLSLYSIYIILSEQVHNLALHYMMNTIEMLEEGEQTENFVEDNEIFIIFILDSFMKTYMSETSDI